MATYVFANDEAFKSSLGKAINGSMALSEMGPTIQIAFEAHLLPWVGQNQWGDIVDAVEANTFTTQQTALLPYLQRAIAHLTMYEYCKIGEIQVSDAGFLREESEHRKGAYKNQINRYEQYMLLSGYAAIESLLNFLEDNTADYPLWTAAPQSLRNREAFINTAATFQLVYSTNISRYVMETLRGLMLDIELFAILPLLGQAFYDELKTAINDKTITNDQQTVIGYIQKAVALFTIEEGIQRNIVQNTGIAIVVNEKLEPQGNTRQGSADATKLRMATRHNDEFGNRYINFLKNYLKENRETFTNYDQYLTAKEEAAEAAAAEAAAQAASDALNRSEIDTGTRSTGKSIIRF